ncbi:hypothetical protein A9404_03560 [Halothiobacillus diazotrophicus]|uniref:Heme-binding protein n=2 Tax=Halothiobacillus diazotrophicus TaxID=1860122 RepID=A0A191ZK89_9GAMM|nr:hypothetical protein A9404_03560 [Halothiobacillus diazotrophicus]
MNRAVLAAAFIGVSAVRAEEAPATWSQKVIGDAVALKAAEAAKTECEQRGWPVSVLATDLSGLPIVLLRSRYAGWHTVDEATGKARTAASWRQPTRAVAARVTKADAPEKGILSIPGVVMIGGGLPIDASGQMVGAIGVSGAPGGENDDICAKAGLSAVEADLAF